jgi:hypothetical protein
MNMQARESILTTNVISRDVLRITYQHLSLISMAPHCILCRKPFDWPEIAPLRLTHLKTGEPAKVIGFRMALSSDMRKSIDEVSERYARQCRSLAQQIYESPFRATVDLPMLDHLQICSRWVMDGLSMRMSGKHNLLIDCEIGLA